MGYPYLFVEGGVCVPFQSSGPTKCHVCVQSVIWRGYKLGVLILPLSFMLSNVPLSPQKTNQCSCCCSATRFAGVIIIILNEEQFQDFYSNLFTVPKSNGEFGPFWIWRLSLCSCWFKYSIWNLTGRSMPPSSRAFSDSSRHPGCLLAHSCLSHHNAICNLLGRLAIPLYRFYPWPVCSSLGLIQGACCSPL